MAESGNNGNIRHIIDNLTSNSYSQDFTYDNLNRLKTFDAPNMSGAVRHQSFVYDSFGNMYTTNSYPTPNNPGDT